VNDEADIQLFVDAKKTGPNRPEELLYRTYVCILEFCDFFSFQSDSLLLFPPSHSMNRALT